MDKSEKSRKNIENEITKIVENFKKKILDSNKKEKKIIEINNELSLKFAFFN